MFRLDDLTLTDFRILALMYHGNSWRHNALTVKELAGKLKVSRSLVYYRLEKVLCDRGLVVKLNSYPQIYKPVFDKEVHTMVIMKINKMVDDLWGIDR